MNDGSPELGVAQSASTVSGYVGAGGCSTAVVIGLSKQIADEAACEVPGSFVSFAGASGIVLTSNAVLPYLVKGARDDLESEGASYPIQVTSALRTLAQQYLLYNWWAQGRCGIAAAAPVGQSNHEGGRAVDLGDYSVRISSMAARGWAHDVPGDVVHFDHISSPSNLGLDVKAFQTLWNANNPSDRISVDGEYGPQTAARLKISPATGFPISSPTCAAGGAGAGTDGGEVGAEIVSVVGPDEVAPQTVAHYTLVVQNTGSVEWPAQTELAIGSGDSSPLYDPSWTSPTVATTLSVAVPVGQQAVIDLDVTTPAAAAATPITQTFALSDSHGPYGTVDLALTVAPDATADTSGDAEPDDGDGSAAVTPQTISSGCSAGGSSSWIALVAPLAFVVGRRRRAQVR